VYQRNDSQTGRLNDFMKRNALVTILGSICLSALNPTASQGGVMISEGSVDWSGNLSSPFVISALGEGINTFSGTLPLSFDGQFDVDVFRVNNPSAFSIASIKLDISNYVGGPNVRGRLEIFQPVVAAVYYGRDGSYNLPASLDTPPSYVAFRLIGPNNNTIKGSANYTVTIAAIPEPSSALAAGLATLGFALWRLRQGYKPSGA
jgi:hypothetical protein